MCIIIECLLYLYVACTPAYLSVSVLLSLAVYTVPALCRWASCSVWEGWYEKLRCWVLQAKTNLTSQQEEHPST